VPHIVIEYSANIAESHDIDALVGAVHSAALDHGLAAPDALRTRAEERKHYRVADAHPANAFVAIAVRIGPGRTAEDKTSFITAVLDAAEANISDRTTVNPGDALAIAWSIELHEIDPNHRINRNHVRTRMRGDAQ